jgi:hypothetical protein
MIFEWISEQRRYLKCGLLVCGCITAGSIIFSTWRKDADDAEGHKVRAVTVGLATPAAASSGSGAMLVTTFNLSGVVGDTISEREYPLQPYRIALIEEPRRADLDAGTTKFGWPPPLQDG